MWLWWKAGWILFIPTILAHIPFYGVGENALGYLSTIVVVVQLIVLIGFILPTEIALRRNFDKYGLRK